MGWKGTPTLISRICSFAINKRITLGHAKMLTSPRELFHLSLSTEIFRQFQLLSSELHGMQMYEHKYKLSYNWGSLSYSSQKAYKLILVTPRYLRPLLVSRVLNVNLNKTILLATVTWQTQHKRCDQEEKDGTWIIYMWKLHIAKDWNMVSLVPQMQLCPEMLAYCWSCPAQNI